jgi:DNA-directed RNA polymerase alpha subunit
MQKTIEITLKFDPPSTSTSIDYTENLINFFREVVSSLEEESKLGFHVIRTTGCAFEIVLSGSGSISLKDNKEDSRKLNELLSYPVQDLKLGVRLYNVLVHKIRLETIGDLVSKTDKELLKIKGFGSGCLMEVKNLLLNISLHYDVRLYLGMKLPESE